MAEQTTGSETASPATLVASATWKRTINSGDLRADHVGTTVTVNGWASSVRDHGGVLFVDLRDRTGVVQIVSDPSRHTYSEAAHTEAGKIKSEFCLAVTGVVVPRLPGKENPNLSTGAVEIEVTEIEILNPCRALPFQLDDSNVNEEARLKHRYLDLRRPVMYDKLRLRHEVVRAVRQFLYAESFLEIETPILTKSTPEGARDYLVPYRLDPGKFYALPQAPQQFKQLLDGVGHGAVFSDCEMFPRRGATRRPSTGVHAD